MSKIDITHGELQGRIKERLNSARLIINKVGTLLSDQTLEHAGLVKYTQLHQGSDYTCGKINLMIDLSEVKLAIELVCEGYRCGRGYLCIVYNDKEVFIARDLRDKTTDKEFMHYMKYISGKWEAFLDPHVIIQLLDNDTKQRIKKGQGKEETAQEKESNRPPTENELMIARNLGIDV